MKAHARGIGGTCRGPPARKGPDDYGGMWGQLQKLRAGKHPKTNASLPPPVDHDATDGGSSLKRYASLDLKNVSNNLLSIVPFDPENLFSPYVPEPSKTLRPNEGKSAKEKRAEMLQRVRQKETNSTKMLRLRGKQKPPSKYEHAVESVDTAGPAAVVGKICWVTRRRIDTANG